MSKLIYGVLIFSVFC